MFAFKSLDKSADLVRGMADRTDTDLSTPLAVSQFRQMVLACSGCTDQDGCAKLQAENDHLDAAPGYCRNAARMTG